MRTIENIVGKYDPADRVDKKKIQIIQWLQKHPGTRFDISEINREIGDELDIGQGRIRQICKELENETVLKSHGNQRMAYQLADDVLIPVKYQAIAGGRRLATIVDVERWGVIGFLVIATILWFFLTFPFWFFSATLVLSPIDHIGPLTQSEIIVFTILMTIWLVMLAFLTASLQLVRRWWGS